MKEIKTISLGEIMATKSGSVDPSKFPDEVFDLYSIPAFDSRQPEVVTGGLIGSTKQIVQPGDVLLSRIVPHIRRSWVVGKTQGRRIIASGEWIVFRSEIIHPEYLRQVLVSDPFHLKFMSTVSGVGGSLLRARPVFVAKIKIPLPPLPEQRRIADILDRAEALRARRLAALAQLDELRRSIFIEMFGNPVKNSKNWDMKKLGECTEFMTSGSRGWAKYYSDTGEKFIRIQNVKNGKLDFSDIQLVEPPETAESIRTKVKDGDLLISITADLGRTAVVDEQTALEGAYINQHLALIRLNKAVADPVFVSQYLESEGGKRQFSSLDQKGVKSGLNFENVKSLQFYLPPLSMQKKFLSIANKLGFIFEKQSQSSIEINNLFDSLMQTAFSGELVL